MPMRRLTPEQTAARSKRNLAIAGALVAFIVLVFAVTVLNLKRNIDARKDALAAGESVERIVQLAAWEESRHFYTEKECAALELTEAVTVLTDGFVPDEVFERAAKHFAEAELSQLIAAITVINAWNRFGVTCRLTPGHYRPGLHG